MSRDGLRQRRPARLPIAAAQPRWRALCRAGRPAWLALTLLGTAAPAAALDVAERLRLADQPLRTLLPWAGAALLLLAVLIAATLYVSQRRLRREVARRIAAEARLTTAHEQRDRAESRHRDTINASPNALLVVSDDGRIKQVTARLAQLAGYEREALIGQPALCLVPERDRAELMATFATFFKSPAPLRARDSGSGHLRRRDGSELPIEASLSPITTRDGVFAMVAVVDISERRFAEDQLRESEERFRDLFDNASDLIQVVSVSGRFLYVNRSWCDTFGYSAAEASTLSIRDIIDPDDREHCQALYDRVLRGQDIDHCEARFRTRLGQNIEVAGHISLRRRDGQPESTCSIFRDVTARNRHIAELAQARQRAEAADRTKSAFLATMSHELRTPLNSIIGFTGIIHKGMAGPLTPEQQRQIGMVQDSARHLLALVNDVLDISKIEAGELKIDHAPFDLLAAIAKVVAVVTPLADAKGLTLRTELPPALAPMTGDVRRVEQVLLNLLSNALKFTQRGEIVLSAQPGDGAVQLRVKDTGIGIKPEDMARLFQPFRQIDDGLARNHDGTGLGLVICQRLAALMGGAMQAQSEWQNGSTFSFTLPYQARESP